MGEGTGPWARAMGTGYGVWAETWIMRQWASATRVAVLRASDTRALELLQAPSDEFLLPADMVASADQVRVLTVVGKSGILVARG